MTEAIPYAAPMRPVNAARLEGRAENAMMVYAPDAIPAPPSPAMARPTMSAVELGATPQIRDPSSKMKMAIKKVVFSGKYL